MHGEIGFLAADWPAPPGIRAGTTLRIGGVSEPPFDSLNLYPGVGDRSDAVSENRARLESALRLPAQPRWLEQVHGSRIVNADAVLPGPADGIVAARADSVCAVLTADCLPVLFCDRAGSRWGAVHAGWRGLAQGVLEAGVTAMMSNPADLMAWLGPAIGPDNLEVGEDVRTAFCIRDGRDANAFVPHPDRDGKYLADIYGLARARLARTGLTAVYGGGLCTMTEPQRFYSYRLSATTGRMASLVWRVS